MSLKVFVLKIKLNHAQFCETKSFMIGKNKFGSYNTKSNNNQFSKPTTKNSLNECQLMRERCSRSQHEFHLSGEDQGKEMKTIYLYLPGYKNNNQFVSSP